MNGYRKELKYIVPDSILMDAKSRISGLMRPDVHQKGEFYRIRSIYCDSPSLRCYHENMAGVSTREKYRIRTYDCNEELILAEIKIRHRETISKMSAKIKRDLFDAIISSDPHVGSNALSQAVRSKVKDADASDRRVLEKYMTRFFTESFRPVVIVDYERSAYTYEIGNVRVTFDRNVTASREFDRMFDDRLTGRPALDDNMHILEIKYDEFLPNEIREVLAGLNLERCSSSKYAKCLARFL